MKKETYEIIIETLANELSLAQWRLEQTEQNLRAARQELETLKKKEKQK